MSEFELPSLADYSEESILSEIRRVAALAPDGPLLRRVFERHGHVSLRTVRRRFGSWHAALGRAGLGHRFAAVQPARVRAALSARALSDAALLAEMRAVADRLGTRMLTRRQFDRHGRFPGMVLIDRFETWRQAVEMAGLEVARSSRRFATAELLDNLHGVWMHLGRAPTQAEMSLPPSRVRHEPYSRQFGSWRRALAAFVEQGNGLGAEAIHSFSAPAVAPEPTRRRRARRPISAGLRFAVLDRDGYRCVACGRSPANHRGCELHIDHIVPWSKGGASTIENLRTLCADCNLGRGNRDTNPLPADPAGAAPASARPAPASARPSPDGAPDLERTSRTPDNHG